MAPAASGVHAAVPRGGMAASDLSPGSIVGCYRIRRELGRGGMGVVFEAEDTKRARTVALKVVSPELASSPDFMARFRREGRVAISHENVVALLDVGEDGGMPFLVLEHVPGGTLWKLLKERGKLPWREAAALGAGIARGLAAVHEARLVHRDLKPANVLLDASGAPKLSDFGLVGAEVASLAVSRALTKTGDVLGTLDYMAPEQADGKREVTASADLYSLGALLFALLTGRPPFEGTGYALLKKHFTERPRAPGELAPDVPGALDALVLRLLEKEPAARPETAAAVARELEAIARVEPERRGFSPRRAALALVLLAVLAASAVVAWRYVARLLREEEAARLSQDGTALVERGRVDEALSALTRAIELEPANGKHWLARGSAYRRKGDGRRALADLTRAVELSPGLAEGWSDRSIVRSALGDLEGAIADATRALELDPALAACWTNRGGARSHRGDQAGAIADFTKALELDPSLAAAWGFRAFAHLQLGELDRAIADGTRAIELEPRNASTWDNRAELRRRKGDLEGAVADATRAIEIDPRFASAWMGRALALSQQGDFAGAIRDMTRAIEIDPGNAAFHHARGGMLREKEDFAAAARDFSRAIELAPRDARSWASRGDVRFQQGDRDGAISDLDRAIELDPRHAMAHVLRAYVREQKGDRAGALSDYERAASLAPDAPEGETARAKIAELKRGR